MKHTNTNESLKLFESATEFNTEAVIITEANLHSPGPKIIYVNPSFTRITGFEPEELIGKSPRIIQGPKTDKPTLKRLKETLGKGKVFTGELVNYRKNGGAFFNEMVISPVKNKDGKVTHFIGIQHDVTERKKHEEEMRLQKETLRLVFDNIPVMIALYDKEGKLLLLNKEIKEKLGWEIKGNAVEAFIHMAIPDKEKRQEIREFIKEEKSYWKRVSLKAKSGALFETAWYMVKLSDGSAISIGQDITNQVIEEDNRKEFISNVAHELKTPVTALKLIISILEKKIQKINPYLISPREIDLVDKELNRITGLVNDMVDMTRYEPGRLKISFENVDIVDTVTKTISKMSNFSKQHQIMLHHDDNITIVGDAQRIEQVLINLITNAIKYSPNSEKIEVTLEKKQRKCRVSVRDFGIGIPADKRPLIFDQFYQINTIHTKGFGLGLFISKEIIERHKGRIWVEPASDKGSIFYFELPLAKQAL